MLRKKWAIVLFLLVVLLLAVPAVTGIWVKSHLTTLLAGMSENGQIHLSVKNSSFGVFSSHVKLAVAPNSDIAAAIDFINTKMKEQGNEPIKKLAKQYAQGIVLDCAVSHGPFVFASKAKQKLLKGFMQCAYKERALFNITFHFNRAAELSHGRIAVNEWEPLPDLKISFQHDPMIFYFSNGNKNKKANSLAALFEFKFKEIHFVLRDMFTKVDLRRNQYGLDEGSMLGSLKEAQVKLTNKEPPIIVQGLSVQERYVVKNRLAQVNVTFKIDKFSMGKNQFGPLAFEMQIDQIAAPAFGRFFTAVRDIYKKRVRATRDPEIYSVAIAQMAALLKGSPRFQIKQLTLKTPDGDVKFTFQMSLNNNTKDINVLTFATELPKIATGSLELEASEKLFLKIFEGSAFLFRDFLAEQIKQAGGQLPGKPNSISGRYDLGALIKAMREMGLIQQKGERLVFKMRYQQNKFEVLRQRTTDSKPASDKPTSSEQGGSSGDASTTTTQAEAKPKPTEKPATSEGASATTPKVTDKPKSAGEQKPAAVSKPVPAATPKEKTTTPGVADGEPN